MTTILVPAIYGKIGNQNDKYIKFSYIYLTHVIFI